MAAAYQTRRARHPATTLPQYSLYDAKAMAAAENQRISENQWQNRMA